MSRRRMIAVSLFAAACAADDAGGVQLMVPADVEFPWNAAYNEADDGRAALLPVDVLAYDAVSDVAVPGQVFELSSDEARFVRADLVTPGEADCLDCLWDAYRDEFVELGLDVADEPLLVETDEAGMARVYAVIDALPPEGRGFAPATVRVSIDDHVRSLRLLPR